jgi:hypothetical protein|nr:MAG TPA: hypothetical protein [Caudoviricetes sp.]
MKTIINLTQHEMTNEQLDGFEQVGQSYRDMIKGFLTFDNLPTREQINACAGTLARIASSQKATHAMIGGAPYLMGPLEAALTYYGVQPLYAFSKRESVEKKLDDGTIQKVSVFKHAGWIEA